MTDGRTGELHALLGVDPAISTERLRIAYESQMNAAVRGNDRSRALALSRAFDAAPAALRRAMYASSPPEDRWLPVGGPARRNRRGLRRRQRARRTRHPGDDPRWRTPLVVGLSVLGVLGLLWYTGALPALLGRF